VPATWKTKGSAQGKGTNADRKSLKDTGANGSWNLLPKSLRLGNFFAGDGTQEPAWTRGEKGTSEGLGGGKENKDILAAK